MIDNTPDLPEPDFGTFGHEREIHIVNGSWRGDSLSTGRVNKGLCDRRLHRRIRKIEGKESRVCPACNELWMS